MQPVAQRLKCAERVRAPIQPTGLWLNQPPPRARDDPEWNIAGARLALGLDALKRTKRAQHLLAGVGGVKLERVEQQRQEPPDGPIAAEQPLPVTLLDRPRVLTQLGDRLLQPLATNA